MVYKEACMHIRATSVAYAGVRVKSTKCFYLCGGSLLKCFNNGIDKLQYPNMGVTNFRSHTIFT